MAEFTITLKPTNRVEVLGGLNYRVYQGVTNTGIRLEMLGLFRVSDPDKRAEFERTVCAVAPGDPAPVRLLSANTLVKP